MSLAALRHRSSQALRRMHVLNLFQQVNSHTEIPLWDSWEETCHREHGGHRAQCRIGKIIRLNTNCEIKISTGNKNSVHSFAAKDLSLRMCHFFIVCFPQGVIFVNEFDNQIE